MTKRLGLLTAMLIWALTAPMASASSFYEDLADGQPRSLEEYVGQGQWTVLMIWAHDCHVCNREARSYQAFHDKHKDKDARVVGLSLDGRLNLDKAKRFVKSHGLQFTNLIGTAPQVTGMFETLSGANWIGTPSFLIFNPQGELLAQQVGAVPTDLIEQFIARESRPSQP